MSAYPSGGGTAYAATRCWIVSSDTFRDTLIGRNKVIGKLLVDLSGPIEGCRLWLCFRAIYKAKLFPGARRRLWLEFNSKKKTSRL